MMRSPSCSLLVAAAGVLLLCGVCCCAGARTVDYNGYTVLRVDASSLTAERRAVLDGLVADRSLRIDRWALGDLMVPPATRDIVEGYLYKNNVPFTTMIEDVGAQIFREDVQRLSFHNRVGHNVRAYPNGANDFFSQYHTLADIETFCAGLVQQYPHLVKQSQIGTSYEGRPIFVYVVTGTKATAGAKPAIYLEGGIHAREWIAHATVTYMLNALVTGYGTDTHITSLLDQLEYHLVPVLNVDGYAYTWSTDRMWRKTTKPNPGSSCIGTDPNRNWDNHWCLPGVGGSTDPCDDSYCGSAAFSEACVKAAADYALAHENIVAFVDFHSYSQLWMTPYGYTSNVPANNAAQTSMAQQAVAALTAVYGTQYTEGNIYSVIYPASGSSADWAYDNTTHVLFSFGVELRDTGKEGFLLDPSQIVPSGNETLASVLAMGDYVLKNGITVSSAPAHAHAQRPPAHFGNVHEYTPRDAAAVAAKAAKKHPQQQHRQASDAAANVAHKPRHHRASRRLRARN